MNKIIEFNRMYEFSFLEEKLNIDHPLSEYYMKLDDLSINLYINLKWIRWGYFFLKSLSENLDLVKEEYSINRIISQAVGNISEISEWKKELIIDDVKIKSDLDFENLIKDVYDDEILGRIFTENTKIQMKLKINVREYLILTNMLYPTLVKWQKVL
jgi:hypothetical protein